MKMRYFEGTVQRCAHVLHASSSKVTLLHEDIGRYTVSACLASR